ncbi:MAG TPA: 5'/3'-nucleotidase SurE, partial [Polyangiaceae bacterium]|nr:5'/3'-nucleotidase SurE [Polyangiaceae bacterium]
RVLPRRPDLVVSGINHGMNLGQDAFYSGTIAAAREGALRGVPAMAASAHPSVDLDAAAALCAHIALDLTGKTHARTPLLNVNVPPAWSGRVRATRLGARIYEEIVDFRIDPRGREYLWLGGPGVRHERDEGTDTDAYDDGAVSITPLVLDLTSVADAHLAIDVAQRVDGGRA